MTIFGNFSNDTNSTKLKLTKMKIAVAMSFQNFLSNLENISGLRKIFQAGATYLKGRDRFHHENEGSQSKVLGVFSGLGRLWQ